MMKNTFIMLNQPDKFDKRKAYSSKRESYLKKKNTLMCGLSEEIINSNGGMSISKCLALPNSTSSPWKGFNIDECIVVNVFETDVPTKVD